MSLVITTRSTTKSRAAESYVSIPRTAMVAVVSLSASAAYAGHGTPSRLSRGHRAPHPRPAVRAAPSRAVHPSRSKKARVRGAPRRERLDVLTKLGMWGVDLDRMHGEGRASETGTGDEESSPSSSSNAPPSAVQSSERRRDDVVPAFSAAAAPSRSSESPPETDPFSASARLASLLSRQKAEMWPTVGTEAWAHARARIVSASEASAALGLDRFRSPERLIADKLSRLDAAEGVDAATPLAVGALNPDHDPGGASSGGAGRARGLGWRAKASGKKGRPKKQKRRTKQNRSAGGVGGRVPSTTGTAPSARFEPPAVTHGNEFEPVARAHYAKMERVEVHEFGLKIHDELPWLGATPDGVVAVQVSGISETSADSGNDSGNDSTRDARLAVLEIKCPFTRPVLPATRAKEHFPQIQVLLQVFGADECHFVQYKPPGLGRGRAGVMNGDRPLYLRETVARDDGWWRANKPRLERFHEALSAAIGEREARLAFADRGDGGVVEDWREDVLANVDGV